jgi:lipase
MTRFARLLAPVRGGDLTAGVWDGPRSSAPTVLAVHGITASHMAWPMVAHALPDVRVVAPDLRGRGASGDLPGPWGMRQHADDLVRLLDATGVDRAVVVGHSMGAFVSVTFAAQHPDRIAGLLLIDGGLPLPVVEMSEDADVAVRLLGPAARRLSMTFQTQQHYRDFWKQHPAFADDYSDVVEAYVDYDLVGQEPALRSSVSLDAVTADARELNGSPDYVAALLARVGPVHLLRAPRGLLNEQGGMYPPDAIEHWKREFPGLVVTDVDGVNHYTIIMTPHGAAAVAHAITETIEHTTGTP